MQDISPELATNSLKETAKIIENSLLSLLPQPIGMEQQVIDAMA